MSALLPPEDLSEFGPRLSLFIFSRKKKVGSTFLSYPSIIKKKDTSSFRPRWRKILDDSGEPCGEVLFHVQIFRPDLKVPVFDLKPEMEKQIIRFFLVNIQNISCGAKLGKIQMRISVGKKQVCSKKSTKPSPYNPAFLSLHEIEAEVPKLDLFEPRLFIEVYNLPSSFSFSSKEIIGRCSIPISSVDRAPAVIKSFLDSSSESLELESSETSQSEGDSMNTLTEISEENFEYLEGREILPTCFEKSFLHKKNFFSSVHLKMGKQKTGLLTLKFGNKDDDLSSLSISKKAILRVYVLNALNVISSLSGDQSSSSSSKENYSLELKKDKIKKRFPFRASLGNSLEIDFFVCFETEITCPGSSPLSINLLSSEKLIGSASIFIDDRFYDSSFRSIKSPLESLKLRRPGRKGSVGTLRLFCEIFEGHVPKQIDISPPEPEEHELRVIVISSTLHTGNMGDYFVSGQIGGLPGREDDPIQSTDTHLRSEDGNANFNWRFLFRKIFINARKTTVQPRLTLALYDRCITHSNDSLCEVNVNLNEIFSKIVSSKGRMEETGNLVFTAVKEGEEKASIKVNIQICKKDYALEYPAGFGRSEPNANPFLDKPEGRKKFSVMHPVTLLKDLLGEKFMRKMMIYFLVGIVLLIMLMTSPLWIVIFINRIFK